MRPGRTLRRITELIVSCCDPEQVLLFGSYAKGQENEDSDLDLLVIGNFRDPPALRGQEMRQLLRRYPIRIDLHCMTPGEIEAELRKPHGFVSSVMEGCIIIYKNDNNWVDGGLPSRYNKSIGST